MKKLLKKIGYFLASAFMLCCFLTACGSKNGKNDYEGYTSVYVDPKFERGFKVSYKNHEEGGGTGFEVKGILDYGGTQTNPWWRIAQWGFENCLVEQCLDAGTDTFEDGWYKYADAAKKVEVKPSTGSIYLYADSSKEYEKPRKYGEYWPSLLVDQLTGSTKRLTEYEELYLDMEFTLTDTECLMTKREYNSDLHSLQFLWFVTVQDLTHVGNVDYLWFGVCPYDARYDLPPEFIGADISDTQDQTGKFTCFVDTKKFMSEKAEVGKKVKFKYNILPEMLRMFGIAQERGYMKQSTLADLSVTSSNFGFELTGTYKAGVMIDSIKLMAKFKES